VVDASAVVAFFLREEGWERLSRYMFRTASVGHVVKEFYNSVWRAVRGRKLTPEEAGEMVSMFKRYLDKCLEITSEERLVDRALEIALESGATVYDALYIAPALNKGKPLLTLDKKNGNSGKIRGGNAPTPPPTLTSAGKPGLEELGFTRVRGRRLD